MSHLAINPMLIASLISAGGNIAGGLLSKRGADKSAREQIRARERAIREANEARERLVGDALEGEFLGDFGLEDIFGSVPEAVLYDPVNIDQTFSEAIVGNQAQLPAIDELTRDVNQRIISNDLSRAQQLIPNFNENIEQFSGVTSDLLAGRLPFSDVLDIVSDRSSLSAALGTPGGSTPTTLKDLGLSRLDAMREGGGLFQQLLQTANQNISPISSQFRPQQLFFTPQQRLDTDLMQNQLDQQSRQSAAFLEATPDPAAASLFNEEMAAQLALAGAQVGAPIPTSGTGDALLGAGISSAANILAGYLQNRDRTGFGNNNEFIITSNPNTGGINKQAF